MRRSGQSARKFGTSMLDKINSFLFLSHFYYRKALSEVLYIEWSLIFGSGSRKKEEDFIPGTKSEMNLKYDLNFVNYKNKILINFEF